MRLSLMGLISKRSLARQHIIYGHYARLPWPKPLFYLFQLFLWLKWVGISAPFLILKTLRNERLHHYSNIPKSQQFRQLLQMTWCAGLPPADVYRFGLIDRPQDHWRYVSDTHVHGFHTYKNKRSKATEQAIIHLHDKIRTQDLAKSLGINTPNSFVIHDFLCENVSFLEYVKMHGPVFCKSQFGARGDHAFSAIYNADDLHGETFSGHALPDRRAVENAAMQLSEKGHFLVQPLLQNHKIFKPASLQGHAITLRYITQLKDGVAHPPLCAYLEVPFPTGTHKSSPHLILPINLTDGTLHQDTDFPRFTPDNKDRVKHFFKCVADGSTLPFWDDIVANSHAMHIEIGALWGIAWDWIITDEGAVLLEGNSGFSLRVPQMICGGLVTP